MNKVTNENITELQPNEIFVFGSNLGGRHGAGAARLAMQWGAEYGNGVGLQGQTYAIPTLDDDLYQLDLAIMAKFINQFLDFAYGNPNLTFFVTQIGCGLAGFTPCDIAPMFEDAMYMDNVMLPQCFIEVIENI